MKNYYPSLLGRYQLKTDSLSGKVINTPEGHPVIVRSGWTAGDVFADTRGREYKVASDGSLRAVQPKENYRDRRARRREQARTRKGKISG